MSGPSTQLDSVEKTYRFGLIPKQKRSPFFQEIHAGCLERAKKINVECVYEGPWSTDLQTQIDLIRNMTESKNIDGIALSAISATSPELLDAIAFANENGVPVITFDSDAADSLRRSFVGTNNVQFGSHLAKVLDQIDPTGGYYGIISNDASNGKEREAGVRRRLEGTKWVELSTSPASAEEDERIAIQRMIEFSSKANAIISVGGWPMRNTTLWTEFVNEYGENITTVCADTLPHQMDMLNRGHVTGLVGQVPFQMGAISMDVLLSYQDGSASELVPKEIFGTAFQEVLTVPVNLPLAIVDQNRIGKLAYAGYTIFGLTAILSLGLTLWTLLYRNHRVVKASQPFFLTVISSGVLVMASSIIPMSMDDGNQWIDMAQERPGFMACMSQIWLVSIGYTAVFAALFSKTWRINRIFHNRNKFSRLQIRPIDVLAPFAALMVANLIVLVLYTTLSPLEFKRLNHTGTDDWNRVISTYGSCQSNEGHYAWVFTIALALVNMGSLLVAMLQAYQARHIQSEFSESQYIAMVIGSLLQTLIIACPVLFLLRENPKVLYMMKVVVVFAVSTVVLVCTFAPKIWNVYFGAFEDAENRSSVRISFGSSAEFGVRGYSAAGSERSKNFLSREGSSDGLRLVESVVETIDLADYREHAPCTNDIEHAVENK